MSIQEHDHGKTGMEPAAVARTRALDEQARFQVPIQTLVSSNPVPTINRPPIQHRRYIPCCVDGQYVLCTMQLQMYLVASFPFYLLWYLSLCSSVCRGVVFLWPRPAHQSHRRAGLLRLFPQSPVSHSLPSLPSPPPPTKL